MTLDARARVQEMTRDGDFSWVADLLLQQRDVLLERWIEVTAAQPFHTGRREHAVANHIPALVDALIALLRRNASPALDPGAALNEPAVLAAAQSHARVRTEQGLTAADVVAEFRLLRQEIGWAMRSHVDDDAPTSDVLGAEMLLHDALDDAAFLAVLAIDEREAELQRLREALAAEQLRLSSLLAQLPAAVIMAEAPSGQVGHPEVKQLTRRPGVPVPAGDNPNEWQGFHRDGRRYEPGDWPLARAVRTGEVVTEEEIEYLRDDGKRGTVSVNAAPVRDGAGVVVAGVAIFTDVTERRSLEQEKQAFLSAITHDLRSPLTTMMGVASLLRREVSRGPVPQQLLLDRLLLIKDAGLRMTGQLTELQDIAQLRTGKAIVLQRRTVDLAALVRAAAERHQAINKEHEISVVQTGLAGADLLGNWDEIRLDRVLDNLIGNALKFSPHGGRITLSLGREGSGDTTPSTQPMAVLDVSDEGMGVPPDDVSQVFEWFRRASNAAGQVPGTGIGLAAARQILELHGGTIGVQSEEGRGSTFTVRLPLALR